MQDSNRQPNRSGGSKGSLFIVIAGVIVLIAAGLVLYNNRIAPPDPTVRETPVTKKKSTPAPLVIAEPSKPLNGKRENGGAPHGEDRGTKREPIGTINVAAVNTFINARFGQVKACYERRLKTNSFLEGKLDLNINIASTGKVTSVSVNRNTVQDSKMLSCVRRTIRGWDFPKPQGGRVIVAKTFHFKKKSS
jgi:hypothetical protein